jgi:hypothetical protein
LKPINNLKEVPMSNNVQEVGTYGFLVEGLFSMNPTN